MKNGQLVFFSFLISLPTMAVVALSLYFYCDKVPAIEKAERGRVREIYREAAFEIRQHPERFSARKMPKAWKSCGQMKPGKWGYAPIPLKHFTWVWYECGGGQALVSHADYVPEADYRMWFAVLGSVMLLVLVGVTVLGIRFFIGYMRERDDFLAATAHDLTTPLVGMRRMIGRNDGEAKRLNERMILIVDNIKDFLKLGGRRKKPDLKSVDIVALAHEAYTLFAADYEDTEGGPVEFAVALGPGQRSEVKGQTSESFPLAFVDSALTLQILWNLFGNDLKYAAPYGKVEVRFLSDEKSVTVEFADLGPGMTPRQMRRAFDRYYRAKTVLETGKGGFGIGLCTAREFARAMGGDLIVRPNAPHGCVFALTLRPFAITFAS